MKRGKQMTIKIYDKLPRAAKEIRQEVFGQEQGFKKEFDEIDPIAKHIILLEDDDPVATCRFYYSKERYIKETSYHATSSEWRMRGISQNRYSL